MQEDTKALEDSAKSSFDLVQDYGNDAMQEKEQAKLYKRIMADTRVGLVGVTTLVRTKFIQPLGQEYAQRPLMSYMLTILKKEVMDNPYVELPPIAVVDLTRSPTELGKMTSKQLAELKDWQPFGGQHSVM